MPYESPFVAARRQQMFPVLEGAELERVRRFGTTRAYTDGEYLARMGERSRGVMVVLEGQVTVYRRDVTGAGEPIVTHGRGGFFGELADITGRPSLVDVRADGEVLAVLLVPERLRAVFISEAELGERILRALILRRMLALEIGAGGPLIIGAPDDRDVLRLQEFLRRNGHPQRTLDPGTDAEARALLAHFAIGAGELPLVLCPNGTLLRNPAEGELARCLGLSATLDAERTYDVAVVGAGPAGLSAAVYAASEGLSVLVLDRHAFGGQAGASTRIENYLGFPTGISGMALMGRAYNQAQKFGVEMGIAKPVLTLERPSGAREAFTLRLANDERVRARAVVAATGARYRRLGVENLVAFEGSSAHYWASPLEARLCSGQEVAVVGGGNSAGQAIVFLAGGSRKIWVLLRGTDLGAKMSTYLVDRIRGLANVEVVPEASVTALEGANGKLQTLRWRPASGGDRDLPVQHLFLFIGAEPNSGWLASAGVALDSKGFVLTGGDVAQRDCRSLETSVPGVFAIGDMRANSTKRIATAVGEGAQVLQGLHRFLGELKEQRAALAGAVGMAPAVRPRAIADLT
ncbi:MAG: FAD-dependent oxidoreductase [Gammaproteobacteria bacterium]|nr:FAD-dependent oxidoreductase [Gammaproteobacteria bacterium]